MIVAPKLGAMSRNKADVATDTVTNLIQNRAESNAAKQNGLTTPVYGNTFDEDRRVRSQNSNLANDDNLTAPTITLQLSDDEVIANALARQKAKGFNGLNVSWTDSPAQQNAKNGGLNVGYSTAQYEGVFFNRAQNSLPASFKQTAGLTNTGATGLISRNPPAMNGVSSLYYQRDALTGLYIDPVTNQPSARISMEVQRKINDASERASSQKVDYGNHRLETWDVAGDRAAAQQLEQTRGKWGAILGAPNAAIGAVPLFLAGKALITTPIVATTLKAGVGGLGSSITIDYFMDDKISVSDVIVSPLGGVFGNWYICKLTGLAGGEAAKYSAQTLVIEGVELSTTWGLEQLPTYSLEKTTLGGQAIHPLLDPKTNPYWGWNNTATKGIREQTWATIRTWVHPKQSEVKN